MNSDHVGPANRKPNTAASRPASALESDEDLAARAASDPSAFAELHNRYVNRIFRFCTFRLHKPEDVEDATNQIFLQALEGLRKSRVEHLRPWLFAIAYHVVTDRYRAQRTELTIAAVYDLPASDESPEDIAISRTGAEELRAALYVLSPDQRNVVELRLAGLTGPEIRKVLGKSRAWVDTTQFRAVQRLRAELASPEKGR